MAGICRAVRKEKIRIEAAQGGESREGETRKSPERVEANRCAELVPGSPDGSADLQTPLPTVDVQIGDRRTKTDKKGRFSLSGVTPGKHEMTISFNGKTIRQLDVMVKSDRQQLDVDLQVSGEKFMGAAEKMSRSIHHQPTASQQDVHAQGFRFYPEQPVGTIAGTGRGSMQIFAPGNIVGCNKADAGVSVPGQPDPNDDSGRFPFNFSDCSISIGLGTAYAGDPLFSWPYHMSYNCFIESIQNGMQDDGQNVYCNGQRKDDGHWNCSWFNGIEHPENLHTHN
jgi:CarboxypepD_reg-like domain